MGSHKWEVYHNSKKLSPPCSEATRSTLGSPVLGDLHGKEKPHNICLRETLSLCPREPRDYGNGVPSPKAGVPNPLATKSVHGLFRSQSAQQDVSNKRVNKAWLALPPVLCLPSSPSPPHPDVEKLSSTKLGPGAKKVGDY